MEPIRRTSSVAALIPHFRCEQWLAGCLESLLEQTRPPEAIIVLDDASARAPVEIVERYPRVTLYRAGRNVGPYGLIQQAIDDLAFDAYLFQDADDWSAPFRLERLLAAAEAASAHMAGSYEVRVLVDDGDVEHVRYPLDVNASLREHPQGFPLLHPTSLVARSLLVQLGGFATGMRFSGDAELLRRAGHVGRIINVPEYLYFRRKRSGALTTSATTGLGAPAREAVQRELRERAERNAQRVAAGETPDLAPYLQAPPVVLEHVAGPDPTRPLPTTRGHHADPTLDERPPIIIVGPPRSGVALLGWCLAQSGAVHPVFDGGWIGAMVRSALDGIEQLFAPAGSELDDAREAALLDAAAAINRILREQAARAPSTTRGSLRQFLIAEPLLALDLPALDRAFPGCRIVALQRPLASVAAAFDRTRAGDAEHRSAQSLDDLWRRCVRGAREAAAALGSERIATVDYDALLDDSEATLLPLMAWLGLEPDVRALRPLAGMRSSSERAVGAPDEPASRPLAPGRWWRDYLERSILAEGPTAPLAPRIRAAVLRLIPADSTVAVVSRGDDALLELDERTGLHFPSLSDGTYLGYHPAGDDDALAHLLDVVERGARYLLVPSPSLWWLEHYRGLARALARSARTILLDPDLAALYEIDAAALRVAARPAATTSDDDSVDARELARLMATGDRACTAIALAVSETTEGQSSVAEREWSDSIERMRDRLNASDEPISIALPSKRRVEKVDSIGAVCRLRSKRPVWGRVLMKLVRRLRPQYVIELGTCMGVSTAYQAAALAINGTGSMVTLEGAPALAALAERNLASIGAPNVRVVQGLFVETLPGALAELPRIDFAFIDGHHDEHATVRYFEAMLSKASAGAVFAFDDIRWSDGMRRAWSALCAHPAVTTSVDLGVIGVCIVGGERHGHFAPGAPREPDAEARPKLLIEPPLGADARVLVVSRGDDALLALGDAGAAHFPGDASGRWLGYHPADSDEAIAMLAGGIAGGATHLLLPRDAFWWLEFYERFARHLDERHALLRRTEDFALYRLTPQCAAPPELHAALDEEHE